MESIEDKHCPFKNRSSTSKFIGEEKKTSFRGTDKLYYKDLKKRFIPKEPIRTRNLNKLLEEKLKNWKTEND